MDKIGKSAFAFLGLGLSLVGLLILRSGALARWIGLLGLAVGILGFLVSIAGLTDIFGRGASELMMGMFILTNLVFMLILGLRLFARTQFR